MYKTMFVLEYKLVEMRPDTDRMVTGEHPTTVTRMLIFDGDTEGTQKLMTAIHTLINRGINIDRFDKVDILINPEKV